MFCRNQLLVAAVVPLTLACGGSDGSNNGPLRGGAVGNGGVNAATNCHIALSGAVSGNYDCYSAPVAQWVSSIDTTAIAFTSDGSPQRKGQVTVLITHSFFGAPTPGTYTGTDENMYGWSFLVYEGGSALKTWQGGSLGMGGSYSSNLSQVGTPEDNSGISVYPIHGTAHTTGEPDVNSGAAGVVTADVTF